MLPALSAEETTTMIRDTSTLARKIWSQGLKPGVTIEVPLPSDIIQQANAQLLSVGHYYAYVFNLATGEYTWVSEGVNSVLGYTTQEFNIALFLRRIHPDDFSSFIACGKKSLEIFRDLPANESGECRIQFDYRVKTKDERWIRIMQQDTAFYRDSDRRILITIGTHTDISHLKQDNKIVMNMVCPGGSISTIEVSTQNNDSLPNGFRFTLREKMVLQLLGEGLSSKEIGSRMNISFETVNSFRKKMLRKTGVSNVAQLVKFGIEKSIL